MIQISLFGIKCCITSWYEYQLLSYKIKYISHVCSVAGFYWCTNYIFFCFVLFCTSSCGKKLSHERSVLDPSLLRNTETPDESPGVKQVRLKAVHRSQSINLGKLAFFHYLERVETMRCFWEMKHIELEGNQVEIHGHTHIDKDCLPLTSIKYTNTYITFDL